MAVNFIKPTNELNIETKKGLLTLSTDEYSFIIDEERETKSLMVIKAGIQKIEDFLNIEILDIQINQTWVNNANFNIFAQVKAKHDNYIVFGVGSANRLNLKKDISAAYATEMAVKRAKSTAILDILRKEYTGNSKLPLLYSSFDEFLEDNQGKKIEKNITKENKVENNDKKVETVPKNEKIVEKKENNDKKIEKEENSNKKIEITEENEKKVEVTEENEKKVKTTKDNENKTEEVKKEKVRTEDEFDKKIFVKKYPSGISPRELREKDLELFEKMVTIPNRYRDLFVRFKEMF